MNGTLRPDQWLQAIREEYLATFIQDGGSTVKFAVHTDSASVTETGIALLQSAADAGYLVASIDAKETRVHMAQNLFFRIARQIDWNLLARKVVLRLLTESGQDVSGVDAVNEPNLANAVSDATGFDPSFLLTMASPLIQDGVFHDRSMSRDFRVAMSQLCLEAIREKKIGSVSHPIVEWLTGTRRGISAVREYNIKTRIVRTNARHFMESLLHWARKSGYQGTAIVLDDSRITLPRNPRDGRVFYTRAMVMDHYELLREIIDSTDRLEGMFMAVLTGTEFEDFDQRSKGFAIYSALHARIANEVRPRLRPNPLAAMARIGSLGTVGEQP